MLEDVPHPGAAIFVQSPDESAGLPIGTTVFGKSRKILQELFIEVWDLSAWSLLEWSEIDGKSNHGEVSIKTRTSENTTF